MVSIRINKSIAKIHYSFLRITVRFFQMGAPGQHYSTLHTVHPHAMPLYPTAVNNSRGSLCCDWLYRAYRTQERVLPRSCVFVLCVFFPAAIRLHRQDCPCRGRHETAECCEERGADAAGLRKLRARIIADGKRIGIISKVQILIPRQ